MYRINKNIKFLIAIRQCYKMFIFLPIFRKQALNAVTVYKKDEHGEHWYIPRKNVSYKYECHLTQEVNNLYWTIPGWYHKENGPAFKNGKNYAYYLYGNAHRIDGPAIVINQSVHWYYNDKKHRYSLSDINVGPAVVVPNKYCMWCKDGLYHRNDFKNGKLLPAVVHANGMKEWWINGIRIYEHQHQVYFYNLLK